MAEQLEATKECPYIFWCGEFRVIQEDLEKCKQRYEQCRIFRRYQTTENCTREDKSKGLSSLLLET